MAAVRSASFSGEMVVMTENSMGRSIRQTWRAMRPERLLSRPARRDRRFSLYDDDHGVFLHSGLVRPPSLVSLCGVHPVMRKWFCVGCGLVCFGHCIPKHHLFCVKAEDGIRDAH